MYFGLGLTSVLVTIRFFQQKCYLASKIHYFCTPTGLIISEIVTAMFKSMSGNQCRPVVHRQLSPTMQCAIFFLAYKTKGITEVDQQVPLLPHSSKVPGSVLRFSYYLCAVSFLRFSICLPPTKKHAYAVGWLTCQIAPRCNWMYECVHAPKLPFHPGC